MSALPAPHFDDWTIADLPEVVWPRHEIIDGSLHVTPPPSATHNLVAQLLTNALNAHVPTGQLALCSGLGVYRTEKRFLVPDVIVVDQSAVTGSGVDPSVVHLAVEVVSPSTELMDRGLKAELYAELGIPTYWVLDQQGAHVPFERASSFESAGTDWMLTAYAGFRSAWSQGG